VAVNIFRTVFQCHDLMPTVKWCRTSRAVAGVWWAPKTNEKICQGVHHD